MLCNKQRHKALSTGRISGPLETGAIDFFMTILSHKALSTGRISGRGDLEDPERVRRESQSPINGQDIRTNNLRVSGEEGASRHKALSTGRISGLFMIQLIHH